MTAITFNADGTDSKVADATKRDWYNYAVQESLTNTYNEETGEWGTSHWANAKLNNNYYVWIPRYAYKIYDDATEDGYVQYTSQLGKSYKIDVKFIGTDVTQENIATKLGASYADYIVHPAFTFGTVGETTTPNELSGIWVGKYETSGTATAPTILPNQVAATKTTISDLTVAKMFDMAKNVLTSDTQKAELDAHMMKNTEWGAVAYLAQSQYGRNGTEISVNQCSKMITGAGKKEGTNLIYESSLYSTAPTSEQKYSGKIGKLSSTTGNIYGVYDMSGGAYEYVMGFYGTAENTPTLGSTGFTADTQPERKYYDLYINKTSADSSNIGDALYETKDWNSDKAYFVYSAYPVFVRGGDYYGTGNAGAFRFSSDGGGAGNGGGFRVCLAVK